MDKPPTIADVARLAGVHKATASRALNPRTNEQVNALTARRVLAAAKRLRYQPNTVARSLSTSRSSTIGILIPDLTNPLFPPVVRGIENALSAEGYTALVANTDNDAEKERARFEALLSRQVDGFIVATARREDPVLAHAHEQGVAAVLVNRSTDEKLFPLVAGDDAAGIAAAVEHLVALGHREIAHLSGPRTVSTGLIRARAFQEATAARALPAERAPLVECAAYTEEAGIAAARQLLDRAPGTTAIVAGNDMIALGALQALRERGLTCPDDMSLVGFNDMRFIDKLSPPLTTVHVPHQQLGAEAARLLLDHLHSTDRPAKTVWLPLRLVVRESTAAPRA